MRVGRTNKEEKASWLMSYMSTLELPTPKPSKIETTTASFVEESLAQGNNVPTQIWQIIMCKRRSNTKFRTIFVF
jgi:hypothetical protein